MPWTEPAAMRILIANSFPIPGDYDGTAMLPINILRALKPRGVDVVVAHLRAHRPGACTSGEVSLKTRRSLAFRPWPG